MADLTLWQLLLKGGPAMLLLAGCSVLVVAVGLERWWAFREFDRTIPAAAANIAEAARHPSAGDWREAVAHGVDRARLSLERWLGVLGTIGAVAPFIGLFGTVLGVMRAFRDLAAAGMGNPTIVAAGIAEALVATAAGLAAAIPAVVLYNYFTHRAERALALLEDEALLGHGR